MKTKQSWKPAGHSAEKFREMGHRRGFQFKIETPMPLKQREFKKAGPKP